MLITTALGLFTVVVGTASAQDYPSYSEWSTTYQAPQGYPVQARVILDGPSGTYQTQQGANGWLEGMQLGPAPIATPGITLGTGTWRFQDGQQGWFKFNFNTDWSSFTGIWGFHGSKTAYYWNGRRTGSGSGSPTPVVTRPPVVTSPAQPAPVFTPPPVSRPPVQPQFTQPRQPSFSIPDPGRSSGAIRLDPDGTARDAKGNIVRPGRSFNRPTFNNNRRR